jgi:hypothetical protein
MSKSRVALGIGRSVKMIVQLNFENRIVCSDCIMLIKILFSALFF